MIAYLAVLASTVALLISLAGLIQRKLVVSRLNGLEVEVSRLKHIHNQMSVAGSALALTPENPLEGLEVLISIQQDHDLPTFATLLRDALLAQDAFPSICFKEPENASALIIKGSVICNGYSEIYFDAELVCEGGVGRILNMRDKPAQGGRQWNLANSLVTSLKDQLTKIETRTERQRAISELG